MEQQIKERKKIKSPLMNKKITIALVKRTQSSLHKDIENGTLAPGGEKSFKCPVDKFGLINPLTPEEQEYLEEVLRIDLNPKKPDNNFWASKAATVRLRKTGRKTESANLELDLNDPYQYILYKIALINPRVANTWAERYNSREYEFVIIDGEVQLQDELNFTLMEDAVQEYLLKHKTSKKKLYDLLRMYGVDKASKQVTYSNSTEWIYNELKKATRKEAEIKKLYKLISLGEKDISMKVFIEDCVSLGLLEKRPHEVRISGGDKIANTVEEAIIWFSDKRNNAIKMRFEQAIEEFYEKHK